jgi:hypothetical protein
MALRAVKTHQVATIPAKAGDVIYDNQQQLTYFVCNDGVRICLNDLFSGAGAVRTPGPPGPPGQSIVGPAGRDGKDSNVPGPRGESIIGPRGESGRDGNDGLIGPKGDTGAAGRDGVVVNDFTPEALGRIAELEFKLNALLEQNEKGARYIQWLKEQVNAK